MVGVHGLRKLATIQHLIESPYKTIPTMVILKIDRHASPYRRRAAIDLLRGPSCPDDYSLAYASSWRTLKGVCRLSRSHA